jgi:pteridine reductase
VSEEAKSRAPVALVTGAARRIGASVARRLHARGCQVLIHYHTSAAEAEQLAADLNHQRSNSASTLQADLTAKDGPQQLAQQVLAMAPRLAVLVNNASRFYPTPVGEIEFSHWQDLVGSNARAPLFLTQQLAGALHGGAVVNILDIHARRPMAGHSVYCMAKAALEMMTLSLARELAPDVRVNGVSPGAILWPEHEQGGAEAEQAHEEILSRVALGRLGEASDIASAVAYLALDAPYVTGQVLAVDGGRSLNM